MVFFDHGLLRILTETSWYHESEKHPNQEKLRAGYGLELDHCRMIHIYRVPTDLE